jgi:hypothetical protein
MEKQKYSEKLKDPRWQKKRLEILNRDNWECQQCGDSESSLVVHHLRYIPNHEPWEYSPHQLLTLCESCHNQEYEEMPECINSLLEQLKDQGFLSNDVTNIAAGFNGLVRHYPPEIISSFIGWFLCNEEIFQEVMNIYFTTLKSRGNKNES